MDHILLVLDMEHILRKMFIDLCFHRFLIFKINFSHIHSLAPEFYFPSLIGLDTCLMRFQHSQLLPPQPQHDSMGPDIIGSVLLHKLTPEKRKYQRCLWMCPDDHGPSHLLNVWKDCLWKLSTDVSAWQSKGFLSQMSLDFISSRCHLLPAGISFEADSNFSWKRMFKTWKILTSPFLLLLRSTQQRCC